MKITIITNAKAVEKVNYILGKALQALRENESICKSLDIKQIDIYESEIFRKQLIKGFFKTAKTKK